MTKPCPKCNQTNPAQAAYCLNCASPLSQQAPSIGAPQQQSWQQQPIGAPMAPVPQSRQAGAGQKALIALILAIVALICCGPFAGIPAAIVGWLELGAIKEGRSSPEGKWMAMAGLWGGIGATVLHAGLYVLYLFFSALGAMSNPYYY